MAGPLAGKPLHSCTRRRSASSVSGRPGTRTTGEMGACARYGRAWLRNSMPSTRSTSQSVQPNASTWGRGDEGWRSDTREAGGTERRGDGTAGCVRHPPAASRRAAERSVHPAGEGGERGEASRTEIARGRKSRAKDRKGGRKGDK
eukprot:scaffold128802_cov32-Tisochrysis_lutea.AAC.1